MKFFVPSCFLIKVIVPGRRKNVNTLPFFLAWRYLLGSKQEKSLSAMIIVCFLGIIIGSFALALVASVMNGFEQATHEQMQGIHSQLIIHANGDLINVATISQVIQHEFPEVMALSASGSGQVILQNHNTREVYNVVLIKGIDPKNEPRISALETKIITPTGGHHRLQQLLQGNSVIIGEKLANIIDVHPGEQLNLLVTAEENVRGNRVELSQHSALVTGTFKIGVDEFDTECIFCSLNFLETLFPESGPTHIGLMLYPNTDEQAFAKKLSQRLGLTVESWKDLYPALVSALKLEKYAMFFILALITLVASMNIISLMFMQITRKHADIAILRTMGMAESTLSQTFLLMGMFIAGMSTIIGLTGAFIVGWLLEHYPCITLPDVYYATHLPCRMTFSIFFVVFAVAMGLSFVALWWSTRRTHTLNIAHVLRSEG
jgi:lipoprotein-releasing system permease protein